MSRIIGLDLGTKTIGVAISDPLLLTVQPLKTIWRKKSKDDILALKEIIDKYEVSKIVIGLPKNMNNTLGPSALRVISFVDILKQNFDLEICYQDERLTTSMGEKALIEMEVRRENRKKYIDKLAASFILETYIQGQKNGRKNNSN